MGRKMLWRATTTVLWFPFFVGCFVFSPTFSLPGDPSSQSTEAGRLMSFFAGGWGLGWRSLSLSGADRPTNPQGGAGAQEGQAPLPRREALPPLFLWFLLTQRSEVRFGARGGGERGAAAVSVPRCASSALSPAASCSQAGRRGSFARAQTRKITGLILPIVADLTLLESSRQLC